MKRTLLPLPLLLVLLAAPAAGAEDFSQYGLGWIYEDLTTAPGWNVVQQVDALPGRASADTIIRIDLSHEMPPVGNQGGQGSCTAWAVGYYHKSHTEWLEHGWDLTKRENQISPSFIYNQINGGVDQGSSFSDAMDLLIQQGGASLADMPYRDWEPRTWPTDTAFIRAIPFRAEDRFAISLADTAGVNRLRQHLANGFTSTLGIAVYRNFDNIREYNNTYTVHDRHGSLRGYHAVTFVGYDDTLTTADGPGAFRLVNSWGTNWGDSGYFWMSYVAVMDTGLSGRAAAYATDRIGYRPTLLGRFRVAHGSREKLGMRFIVGPRDAPLARMELRPWRRFRGLNVAFPNRDLVFDLTEVEPLLRETGADSLFFVAYDGYRDGIEGTIEHFSVEDSAGNYIARSWDTPLEIPQGCWVGAYALIPLPLGVREQGRGPVAAAGFLPAVARGSVRLPEGAAGTLRDATGRQVMRLGPGENDIRGLSPGVYFYRAEETGRQASYRLVVAR